MAKTYSLEYFRTDYSEMEIAVDRSKVLKVTILVFIMVVLIIGYYSYLTYRNKNISSAKAAEEAAQEVTPVQELLARAYYKEYPSTPVQVVKYYNEITACFYNEEYSDEELEKLAELTRDLYDSELLANQSFEDYVADLKKDIDVFSQGNITVYDSEVTPATDVIYFSHNGYECAKLNCVYTLKSGTNYQSTKEVYILRKDSDGHWKIYGFALDEEET